MVIFPLPSYLLQQIQSPSSSNKWVIIVHCELCLVAQSCPTLCNPMVCSLPDSSVHGDSLGTITGVGCYALLQGIFPTQGSNWGLSHCRLHHLSHQGIPGSLLEIILSSLYHIGKGIEPWNWGNWSTGHSAEGSPFLTSKQKPWKKS